MAQNIPHDHQRGEIPQREHTKLGVLVRVEEDGGVKGGCFHVLRDACCVRVIRDLAMVLGILFTRGSLRRCKLYANGFSQQHTVPSRRELQRSALNLAAGIPPL
jgi:hypothetical protein